MTNLLSPETKRIVRREYTYRFISMGMLLMSFALIAATVLLLPSYLNITSELSTVKYETETVKASGEQVVDGATQDQVRKISDRIHFLNNTTPEAGLFSYIEYASVLATLPDNLEYLQFQFSTVDTPAESSDSASEETNTPSQLVVSGIASARAQLAEAINEIESLPWVVELNYPLSDLSSSSNISFTITIVYNRHEIPEVQQAIETVQLEMTEQSDIMVLPDSDLQTSDSGDGDQENISSDGEQSDLEADLDTQQEARSGGLPLESSQTSDVQSGEGNSDNEVTNSTSN